MANPSKQKVRNFRKKINDILTRELELREEIRRLYRQFELDIDDEPIALRHVRQAYFSIQKKRITKLINERMEFHPFFSANSFEEVEEDSGDDDII